MEHIRKRGKPYIDHITGPTGGIPTDHIIDVPECFNDSPEEQFDTDDLDAWKERSKK